MPRDFRGRAWRHNRPARRSQRELRLQVRREAGRDSVCIIDRMISCVNIFMFNNRVIEILIYCKSS